MHFIAGFCVCCMPKAALKIWRQFGTNDRLLISAVLSHVNYRGEAKDWQWWLISKRAPSKFHPLFPQLYGIVSLSIWITELQAKVIKFDIFKGQLNSECIYEVIVSSKMPTKNYREVYLWGHHFYLNPNQKLQRFFFRRIWVFFDAFLFSTFNLK